MCVEAANASDWVNIGETEDSAIYLDMDSIRSVSPFKQAWVLYDLKKAVSIGKDSALSFKSLETYSCSEEIYRVKTTIFYSGQKGSGNVVESIRGSSGEALYVTPDTAAERAWKKVCNFRK